MATLLSAESENQQDILQSAIATPRAAAHAGTLIVVLGMHRGGTSAINRAMVTLGADLGDHLGTPKAGENDKGFFEDLDIVEINEQILAAAHSKWHTLAPVDFGRIDPAKLAALRMKAASVLRERCRNRTFALKDPRLSRLLAFWQPVFDQVQLRVAYVIAVRNPVSVGLSLQKRNGFAPERSYSLWLGHMVPALRATHNQPRAVVEYDSLMDSPRDELTRMARQLGFVLNEKRARTFESEFLDKGLQHWRYGTQDFERMRAVPREARELFTALVSVSRVDGARYQGTLEIALRNAQCHLEALGGTQSQQGVGSHARFLLQQIAAPFRAMRGRLS
ncbi:sulfotransferase family protein [Paraburkholderia acidipaludis]|uniref:sulfotransferase family protein n=1 Tax=Paraburkholderia acidipaludis TaxID=660537 RepID=UPI0012EC95D0|nr:hypothetical protein [Paraburkholderia acidipaludis]